MIFSIESIYTETKWIKLLESTMEISINTIWQRGRDYLYSLLKRPINIFWKEVTCQWYSLDELFSSWRNVRWAKDYIQWRVWLLLYWDQEKSHKLSSDPRWKTSLLSLPGGAANALCIILVFMKISEKTWCDWMNIV